MPNFGAKLQNNVLKGQAIYTVDQINLLDCKFLGELESHRLFKLSANHNWALPGCTVHFDWVIFWQAAALVLLMKYYSLAY